MVDEREREGTKSANTIRSYLTSLREFLKFVEGTKPDDASEIEQATIGNMFKCIDRWNRSLRRDISLRKSVIATENSENRLEPRDLRNALLSERAQEGVLKSSDVGSIDSYRTASDYWIFYIVATCAQRVGAIINLTVQEVDKHRIVNDHAVITITNHKTGHIAPAKITIPLDRFKDFQNFINLRNSLEGIHGTSDYVFVSSDGFFCQMTASATNKRLQKYWQEAGQKSKFHATMARQTISTELINEFPNNRNLIARQLNHSLSTQERHYALQNRDSESVAVCQAMKTLLTETPTGSQLDNEVEEGRAEAPLFIQNIVDEVQETAVPPAPVKSTGRRTFSKDEVLVLKMCCSGMECLTQNLVKNKLMKNKKGKALIEKYTNLYGEAQCLKKLTDRLRTARRNKEW